MPNKYIRRRLRASYKKMTMSDGSIEYVIFDKNDGCHWFSCKTEQAAIQLKKALNNPNVVGLMYDEVIEGQTYEVKCQKCGQITKVID